MKDRAEEDGAPTALERARPVVFEASHCKVDTSVENLCRLCWLKHIGLKNKPIFIDYVLILPNFNAFLVVLNATVSDCGKKPKCVGVGL